MFQQRYAMLTVDTEALPKRAEADHVRRLIWGSHASGEAGIRQLSDLGNEFGVKHVFFVDLCGAYGRMEEMREVVRWLNHDASQDVQLHAHPEVLPQSFWREHGLDSRPSLMNEYSSVERAEFVLRHFGGIISEVTGEPVRAFRAGSFRWNSTLIQAMRRAGFELSCNNSMRAFSAGRCTYGEPTSYPFMWSNGVIEIPITESNAHSQSLGGAHWASLTFPESPYFGAASARPSWFARLRSRKPSFSVFLLHSWSLLQWDEAGYATYRNDQRLEAYRKLLGSLSKDYDVITTRDFLDLRARGKIPIDHEVDIDKAVIRK
ncbi:polysaccharide deacetylase [Achromobacter piechaudii]|nr:polysaccharide deacetylase [Achromobacter piechaudii]